MPPEVRYKNRFSELVHEAAGVLVDVPKSPNYNEIFPYILSVTPGSWST